MPLSPSSSLSRGSRPIGPIYNETNRAARKLKRQGFDKAAEVMAMRGAEEKLAGGGSNITSAESNQRERDLIETNQSGLMRQQRDSLLRPEAGATDPSGGTQYQNARGRTTNASLNASLPGETPSQVEARQRASRAGTAGTTPTAPTTLTRPVAPGLPGSTLQGPPAPKATVAPVVPEPEGKIDGMPASQAIAGAQRSLASGGPRQEYGKAIGTNNLDKLGLAGALADFRRREQLDAERPARAAAWQKNEDAAGAGNMAQVEAAKTPSGQKPAAVSPLQRLANESRARRDGYAADSVAADKITAGLNAAPTPKLDTSFPVAPAPRELAGSPTSGLRRPTAERATFVPPARDLRSLISEGYTDKQANEILKGQKGAEDPEEKRRKAAAYKLTRMGNTSLPRIPISDTFENTAAGSVARYLNR